MRRTPAVSLSILLASSMAFATTLAVFAAPIADEECCSQPGRLETAREIKTDADAFIVRGRDLRQKLNERIEEAEKLKNEAQELQQRALLFLDESTLLAQANSSSATDAKPTATTSGDTLQPSAADASTPATTDAGAPATTDSSKSPTGSSPTATGKPDTADDGKPLSGRASQLQTLPQPNIPLIRLKGPQFQEALKQFNVDVAQFKVHAAEYQKHLNLFRSQIGECQAAKGAFDALHKKYEMHCDAYHLNNIPPPHLCLEMNVSASEASSIANQLMSDEMRALRAEAQLNAEEAKLSQLEGMQGKADNLVVKASERARREREIAGMFGRLRQEYDLLEIERKTIEHSRSANSKPSPVVRPYVSGKIKKGK